jgi:SAM-dependent methyltransferase
MTTWDERFRAGSYPSDPDPSPVLREYVDTFPAGRALDVATGTGRNAVFLAEEGYDVDAIDRSREGLRIARRNAADRGVEADCDWLQADAAEFDYPVEEYDVITISFFRTLDRLPDIKAALKPDGILFYQHHLRSAESVEVGPSTDRYRFAANELLHACLDLTVLCYGETTEKGDGRRAARALVVARNSTGGRQTYPTTPRSTK